MCKNERFTKKEFCGKMRSCIYLERVGIEPKNVISRYDEVNQYMARRLGKPTYSIGDVIKFIDYSLKAAVVYDDAVMCRNMAKGYEKMTLEEYRESRKNIFGVPHSISLLLMIG